ncbi:hypothetical protein Salat_1170700 [Sesamum alatum]|uniref:Uncharacterized protein n=1 Tax=Sesamum alatum TaxID=300844 RepID=A0AAE1YEI9_9LAMI|nr:hypothetical protein Salat_1170700 [Sesamum alatum]
MNKPTTGGTFMLQPYFQKPCFPPNSIDRPRDDDACACSLSSDPHELICISDKKPTLSMRHPPYTSVPGLSYSITHLHPDNSMFWTPIRLLDISDDRLPTPPSRTTS